MGCLSRGHCGYSAVGAVVGATYPHQAQACGPDAPHHLSGAGLRCARATAADVVGCFDAHGYGAIINASRSILFAFRTSTYAAMSHTAAARAATLQMIHELRQALGTTPESQAKMRYNGSVLSPLAKVVTQRRTPIKRIEGNVTGLKANQIRRLQHIYRRKVPAQQIVTQELARYLCELSLEINRQIGVLIDRKGTIEYVVVGDHKASFSPILGARAWQQIVCAVCATYTHLRGEPFTPDDMADLAHLRFDVMVAIDVGADGLPDDARVASSCQTILTANSGTYKTASPSIN